MQISEHHTGELMRDYYTQEFPAHLIIQVEMIPYMKVILVICQHSRETL